MAEPTRYGILTSADARKWLAGLGVFHVLRLAALGLFFAAGASTSGYFRGWCTVLDPMACAASTGAAGPLSWSCAYMLSWQFPRLGMATTAAWAALLTADLGSAPPRSWWLSCALVSVVGWGLLVWTTRRQRRVIGKRRGFLPVDVPATSASDPFHPVRRWVLGIALAVAAGYLVYWSLHRGPYPWPDPVHSLTPAESLATAVFAATVAVVMMATPARRWLRDRRSDGSTGVLVRLDWAPPDDQGSWDVGVMGLHGDVVMARLSFVGDAQDLQGDGRPGDTRPSLQRPSSAFLTGQVRYRGLVRIIAENGSGAVDALVKLPGWHPWHWARPTSGASGPTDEVTGD